MLMPTRRNWFLNCCRRFASNCPASISGWPISNLAIWLRLNPIGDYIEMMRDITLHARVPNPFGYLLVVAVSYAVFLFGYQFFMRYKSVIVDVI